MNNIKIIGAGLAGSEAAWQLAQRGVAVELYEMRPAHPTPAHSTGYFAELVCSNSLRGAALSTAPGLLKEELRRADSLIMACADATETPAGGALAVDRVGFAARVTAQIEAHPNITVVREQVTEIPDGPVIIASGPLTEGALADAIGALIGGEERLHFYDAAAPIVSFDSIDMESAYFASRYNKGTADYINCPLTREQYLDFVRELAAAEEAPVHGFEDKKVFEGCMPVEVMARRGEDTLRYGPMKPVGLCDPRTGERAYAVLQLRADDRDKTMFNLVGFQTHLKFPEQKRVFGMIPALRKAEYLRYGVMHRNSFLNSPQLLDGFYRLKSRPDLWFAGQITGVEGYIESCASGLCAGIHAARQLAGRAPVVFPRETALGALACHVSEYDGRDFQPMNINFGIITPLGFRVKGKRERYLAIAERALEKIDALREQLREDIQ